MNNHTAQADIPAADRKFSRLSTPALTDWEREARTLGNRTRDADVMTLARDAGRELRRRRRECPKLWLDLPVHVYQPPKPKPFKYGLTPKRRRALAHLRRDNGHLAREIHVWTVVLSAPYTTLRSLADACASGSGLSFRTWQRVAGDMLARGEIKMGADGYELGSSIKTDVRPGKTDEAKARLASRVGDETGPRDASARAKRVRRVVRYGIRHGQFYSSERRLAEACAGNGSGTVEGYRRVIRRMLSNASDLDRRWDGSIYVVTEIIPDWAKTGWED